MLKLHSQIEPDKLLHIIVRKSDIKDWRLDICPEKEFLQISCHNTAGCEVGKTTRPHKHLEHERPAADITQESWVVIQGRIFTTYFDIDDSLLYETSLEAGDCSVTFRGGHSLKVIDQDTLFFEYKLGPYAGVENDREFIEG